MDTYLFSYLGLGEYVCSAPLVGHCTESDVIQRGGSSICMLLVRIGNEGILRGGLSEGSMKTRQCTAWSFASQVTCHLTRVSVRSNENHQDTIPCQYRTCVGFESK